MNLADRYIDKRVAKLKEGKEIPTFRAGDTLKVHNTIVEGENKRTQIFEGVCIGVYNKGIASSFKVKKVTKGMVFEKSFPLYSPLVSKIEVMRRGAVRQSKIYYMRELVGKAARIKESKRRQKEAK